MIVGILGFSTSGKSEAAKILVDHAGFNAIGFADRLKRVCMQIFDFSVGQMWGDLKERPDERYPREHVFGGHYSDPGEKCKCCRATIRQWQDGKTCFLTPRYAMQLVGTEGARAAWSDIWLKRALDDAKFVLHNAGTNYNSVFGARVHSGESPKGMVFVDNRFLNECDGIWNAGGKVYRIKRTGVDRPPHNHPSETEQLSIVDARLDGIIMNDGSLADLKDKVLDVVLKG